MERENWAFDEELGAAGQARGRLIAGAGLSH
jgi:hypothetical protein